MDSPLCGGANFKRIDLSTGPDNPVFLDVFADEAKDLEITPEELQAHQESGDPGTEAVSRRITTITTIFCFSLSDVIGGQRAGASPVERGRDASELFYGLGWRARASAICWRMSTRTRGMGSSAGRRTCGRRTSTCRCGTICCGCMKGRRNTGAWCWRRASGHASRRKQARDEIAGIAAGFEASKGREWRPLVDTTNQPTISISGAR